MSYVIARASSAPDLSAAFDSADWAAVKPLVIGCRRREGDEKAHPEVMFKLQYTDEGLYGLFQAREAGIRCVAEKFQDNVCTDSCLECFLQPNIGTGYVNFEVNASGVMLVMHVVDERRTPGGFVEFRYLTADEAEGVRFFHTLPDRVDPPIMEETTYRMGWFIPFKLFAKVFGAPAPVSGSRWRGNAFKCGDDTPTPHYFSAFPLRATNFHTPQTFQDFIFG